MDIIILVVLGIAIPILLNLLKKKRNIYTYSKKFIYLNFAINIVIIILFKLIFKMNGLNRGTLALIVLFIAMNILIDSSFIDIKYMEIPDFNNLLVFMLGIIYLALIQPKFLWMYIVSSVALFVFSFIMACVSTLGGGDIKLLTAIGLFVPVDIGMYVLFLSCIIALIFMACRKIYYLFVDKKGTEVEKEIIENTSEENEDYYEDLDIKNKNLFPFGQFIVLAFFIILFCY